MALVTVKTGSQQYNNIGTDLSPDWSLSSRDTIIYDAAGHEVLSMSSRAESGWARENLSSLDSTIYSNGKIVENVSKSFYSFSGTISTSGYRSTIVYQNNDKVVIATEYDWDDLTQIWRPSNKDSAVFSAPAGNSASRFSDLTYLTGLFFWNCDASGNSWKSSSYYAKTDGECTATTLVLTGINNSAANSSVTGIKMTLTFSSPAWTQENMVEQIMQQKDPATGSFINVSKYVQEVNANGYQLGYKDFTWDVDLSAWVPSYFLLDFPDAHGNDTFYVSADFDVDKSVWDTNGIARYALTYDAAGNNTEVLAFSYSSVDHTWSLETKIVNTFSLVPMAVKRPVRQTITQNIAVKISPTVIVFSGRNIEGVDLFSATGRLVSSVNQKPAPTLSFNLTGNGASIPSGVYIAQVRTTSGKCPVRLSTCRY